MHLNKLVLPICCAFLCGSCAEDVANRYYVAQRYPERDPRSVELLFHAPSRPFNVIADFQSRGESPEAFRKRAPKIGDATADRAEWTRCFSITMDTLAQSLNGAGIGESAAKRNT